MKQRPSFFGKGAGSGHTAVAASFSKDARHVTDLSVLVKEKAKFSCIYADPPWRYDSTTHRGAAENHYHTMSLEDIAALPIKKLVTEKAHLHFWTTNSFLFESKEIIEAWGFEYKSAFVWVKPQIGAGRYWRNAHEYMLLGVRGNLTFSDKSQPSWKSFDRKRHSEKPREIRKVIEAVSPGPYLELFGRTLVKGWTVFGNDIASFGSKHSHSTLYDMR